MAHLSRSDLGAAQPNDFETCSTTLQCSRSIHHVRGSKTHCGTDFTGQSVASVLHPRFGPLALPKREKSVDGVVSCYVGRDGEVRG